MLIATRATLGLLTDIDILLFFEKGIRGGMNGICKLRHFVANNKDLDSFEVSQHSVYGSFFDVPFLSAGTTQQTLPLDSYSWNATITLAEVLNTSDDSPVGYFVDVDLDYLSYTIPTMLCHSHQRNYQFSNPGYPPLQKALE